MKKWVYAFSAELTDGSSSMSDLLGGKGAALAEMSKLGLNVPPGFTIITEACNYYTQFADIQNTNIRSTLKQEKKLKDIDVHTDIETQVKKALQNIEKLTGRKFGDDNNPLLLSVRSGAKISMPGMMDTILNLGLNDTTVQGLIKQTKDERFSYDSYRRFIQMYGNVVMGVNSAIFDEIIFHYKTKQNVKNEYDLDPKTLQKIVLEFKSAIHKATENHVPENVNDQLWNAINAVFYSWNSDRAIKYRKLNNIAHNMGTAVNVQSMVFGNLDNNSCTGVAFTRNPNNGANEMFGEFLINAQGEDVVSGSRDTQPINIATKKYQHMKAASMEEVMPKIYKELLQIGKKLEIYYHDMQDIEFTVERGKLWILQSRRGKRTINAALQIGLDLISEKIASPKEALGTINPSQFDKLLHPTLSKTAKTTLLGKGLAASPGAVSGKIVFNSQKAESQAKKYDVILVRTETSPEDIGGMSAAKGILTSRGGMTSHAAVVARGMGKPCVCGLNQMIISDEHTVQIGGQKLKEGDTITIDGASGEVFLGAVATVQPTLPPSFSKIMKIADKISEMQVLANAETENDIKMAIEMNAEGIGLCRTEHMFFAPERITDVRNMILASNEDERSKALQNLSKYQENDFKAIFRLLNGIPIAIRLLDPPLHEFLPHTDSEIDEYARRTGMTTTKLRQKIKQMHEYNPMLGHRGCRLAITNPEIYVMQVKAIMQALIDVSCESEKNTGTYKQTFVPEIMIPLVLNEEEVLFCKNIVTDTVNLVEAKNKKYFKEKIKYKYGTMIELPRAALNADKIGRFVDFMSFGTNDLTQTTLGISRDDASSFIPTYLERGILKYDPFISIDESGVGELIKIAVQKGRSVNKNLKIGICGEQGGDPQSIAFCQTLGLDYVSCSPFRLPIAKIAAAQSVK